MKLACLPLALLLWWAGCVIDPDREVETALARAEFVQPEDTTGWRRVRALADSISFLVPAGYTDEPTPAEFVHGGRVWVGSEGTRFSEVYGLHHGITCALGSGVVYRVVEHDDGGAPDVSRETCRIVTSSRTGYSIAVSFVADRDERGPDSTAYRAFVSVEPFEGSGTGGAMTIIGVGSDRSVWQRLRAISESVELRAQDANPPLR